MSWFSHLWWWVEIHTGIVNEGSVYYAFWSGFGSDIGEVVLIGGIIAVVRHHTCAHRPCWRIGRHVTVDGHKLCHRHLAMPTSALELPVIHQDHR